MKRLARFLAIGALALASACAGDVDPVAATDTGMAALSGGDYADAYRSLHSAVEAMEPGHPQYLRARSGRAEACAHFNPEQAVEDYLDLAESHEAVGPREIEKFASTLKQAGSYSQAVVLLDRASQRYPEEDRLRELFEQMKIDADKDASPEELDALAGLGYAGG